VTDKPSLGISSCLLGSNVRYDGGHKLDRYLSDVLGRHVHWVPVCPEVECGLGVPRESMRLVGDPASPRLITTHTGTDHTQRMERWARQRSAELEREDLCGFVFKSRSPSKLLSADEKAELTEVIGQYHHGLVPLIVPIVLLRHHARRVQEPYLSRQLYLNPYPAELMLRNHV
jgi:uncharacterized protein YbbK (DUF523 family)